MRKLGLMILLTAAVQLTASTLLAQEYRARFGDMDLNMDGKVSWEEFHQYYPEAPKEVYIEALGQAQFLDYRLWHEFKNRRNYYNYPEYYDEFREVDLDNDGYVSWEEFHNYYPLVPFDVFEKVAYGERYLDRDLWRYLIDRYGHLYMR